MKTLWNGLLGTVGKFAGITLCVLGLWWVNSTYLHFGMTDLWSLLPSTQATPGNISNFATQIADFTPSPGPSGANALSTLSPATNKYVLGDLGKLKTTLNAVFATKGFDFRVSTVGTTGGTYPYCFSEYFPTLFKTDDPTKPVLERLQAGTLTRTPGMGYCSIGMALGDLWAGVPQKDLDSLSNYSFEVVQNPAVTDPSGAKLYTQGVNVTVTARVGLLTQSTQVGNLQTVTVIKPNDWALAITDAGKWAWSLGKDNDSIQQRIDQANNLARDGAILDFVAPFKADGSRSSEHLDQLYAAVVSHFSTPSPDPANPYPYDNLRLEVCRAAQAAGYQALDSQGKPTCNVTVVITWPYEQNTWYYLDSIDTASPHKVVDPADLIPFKDNLYPVFRDDIVSNMGSWWGTIPSWANSWLKLP